LGYSGRNSRSLGEGHVGPDSETLFARAPDLRLQDAWRSATRRISTAGGATRISLKDCIQSAVSSPDPALAELIDLIQGAQLDLELQRRTTMAAG
jgi:hypothetical protein